MTVSDGVFRVPTVETTSLEDAAVAFLESEFLSACGFGEEVYRAGLNADSCSAGRRGRDEGVDGFPDSRIRTRLGVLPTAFQLQAESHSGRHVVRFVSNRNEVLAQLVRDSAAEGSHYSLFLSSSFGSVPLEFREVG